MSVSAGSDVGFDELAVLKLLALEGALEGTSNSRVPISLTDSRHRTRPPRVDFGVSRAPISSFERRSATASG